jgi:predicted metal-dependent peptidase
MKSIKSAIVAAEERLERITDAWFLKEPLLFITLNSHALTPNSAIRELRTGEGRIEYNSAWFAALPPEAAEERLRAEVIRILLRHPYREPPSSPDLSYEASNITLNEYYIFRTLPFHAADFWSDEKHRQQNYEFYCAELMKEREEGNRGQGIGDRGKGGFGENAALWKEDEFQDMKAGELIQFAQRNRQWGSIMGTLREALLATLRPRLDFRRILNAFRASTLASDKVLTRLRPSRRYGWTYMGKKGRFTTRLLLAVDVSGSIADDEIRLFYSTINRFFKYGVERVDALQFDAGLRGEPVVMKKASRDVQVTGRGGTDFQPVINYYAAHAKQYCGLIIFTDGFAPPPVVSSRLARSILWLCCDRGTYNQHKAWMRERGRAGWIET